ncbi:hypothetical protein DFQ28_000823 [Apophysomyces sp. BC1034]|nr:hypothetical protein DFQ29_000539 [Apophysomyces sp. BC1021]KAG0183829.1 hypothetical protein DFQ28_000823 [Apophysomyces sp. BC1034]
MPPPSTCLFSDKMELNSEEAQALFDQYMNKADDFVSIDLNDRPFYSSAAANIQHKAATIKSTLRQSLRRQKSKAHTTPAHQLFSNMPPPKSKDEHKSSVPSRQSSITSRSRRSSTVKSDPPPATLSPTSPSPVISSPMPQIAVSPASSQMLSFTKDRKRDEDIHSAVKTQLDRSDSYKIQKDHESTTITNTPKEEEEEEEEDKEEEEKTMHAARRVIRTASRKARSRSMIVNAEGTQRMFQAQEEFLPPPAAARLTDESQHADTMAVRRRMIDQNESDGTIRGIKKPSIPDGWRALTTAAATDDIKFERRLPPLSGSATVAGKTAMAMMAGLTQPEDVRVNTVGRNAAQHQAYAGTGSTRGVKSLRAMFDQAEGSSQPMPTMADERGIQASTKYSLVDLPPKDNQRPLQDGEDLATADKQLDCNRAGRSNVDTIRRMLQATWNANNLRESGSMTSLTSSEMSGHSTLRMMGISPPGSINPRLQNQHLVSLSLKARQQPNRRPAMPSGFMTNNRGSTDELQGPTPTASFSSSTVRTMIPEEDQKVRVGNRATGRDTISKRLALNSSESDFGTMRNIGRQHQKYPHPWVDDKTPAQQERDRYLNVDDDHYKN